MLEEAHVFTLAVGFLIIRLPDQFTVFSIDQGGRTRKTSTKLVPFLYHSSVPLEDEFGATKLQEQTSGKIRSMKHKHSLITTALSNHTTDVVSNVLIKIVHYAISLQK